MKLDGIMITKLMWNLYNLKHNNYEIIRSSSNIYNIVHDCLGVNELPSL